ncbi:MAG TPA: hypothetical protein VEF04_16700, partial [Blastocatellia bacterium]|nr:hypothetical protein [Blastocatellia bacterium]
LVYPFAIAATLLPLALMLRSRVLYVMTFAGITASLAVITGEESSARFVMLAIVLGGFLTWSIGEWHRASGVLQELGNWTAGLGITALGVSAYIWSFRDLWRIPMGNTLRSESDKWMVPVAAATLVGVVFLVRAWSSKNAQGERHLLQAGLATATLLLSGCVLLSLSSNRHYVYPVILTNLAAVILAAVAIWNGIVDERRIAFWLGSVFAVLLIISRFLEYDTSLMIKSLVFILCGLAVMLAGTTYERYLRRKEATQ